MLLICGIVAALAAGGYFWMARPQPQPVPAPEQAAGPSPAPVPSAAVPASQGSQVVVHVYGKVRRPGVVTLPSGSRVADAIKATGGVRPGAATGSLNLARKVIDGEQIPVGVRAPQSAQAAGPTAPSPPAAAAPGAPGGAGAPGAPLDLNTATVEQLDQLPGVGPVLAQRIVDHRTQHGAFRSVDQLQEVSGIGSRRFADLKSLVRV
ncbi:helix-hairpin-helix domain-containing protein [Spirillospora sp. CA-255316]